MVLSSEPVYFLTSPPIIIPQPSGRSDVSADSRSSYFSSVSPRTVAPKAAFPPDGLSTSFHLSPRFVSPSWSEHSADSADSSYLTPPQSQWDGENPPYKSRSASSASLDMSHRRSDTISHGKHKKGPKGRRSRRKRKQQLTTSHDDCGNHDNESRPFWWLPDCEMATNTPPDFGDQGEYLEGIIERARDLESPRPIHVDGHKGCLSQLMSLPAAAVITRRWSSVGIGNQDVSSPLIGNGSAGNKKSMGVCNRSRTWTHGFKKVNIREAVRARLIARDASARHPEIPATITLRRPSGMTIAIAGKRLPAKSDAGINGAATAQTGQKYEEQPPSYILSKNDPSSVTEHIPSTLVIRSKLQNRSRHPGLDFECSPVDYDTGRLSFTSRGVLLQPGVSAGPATTVTDVHQVSYVPQMSCEEMDRSELKQRRTDTNTVSWVFSRKSVHEIIWEENGSPRSLSSRTLSSKQTGSNLSDHSTVALLSGNASASGMKAISSQPESPKEHLYKISDQGDPSPTSRVFRWVWGELTQAKEVSSELATTESSSQTLGPAERTQLPTGEREPLTPPIIKRPDVVSFPPLPTRQFTSDWISPLPDITTSVIQDYDSSLYEAGIDARYGTAHNLPTEPLLELSSWEPQAKEVEHGENSPGDDSSTRRKSAVVLRIQAVPRIGESSKLGNAIGTSSGARRKVSTRSARIQIDYATLEHQHCEDETPWTKPRKDSGWPAPKPPSPEELDSRKASSEVASPPRRLMGGETGKGKKREKDRPKFDQTFGSVAFDRSSGNFW